MRLTVIMLLLMLSATAAGDTQPRLVTFDYAVADTLAALDASPVALAGLRQYRELYQQSLLTGTDDLGMRHQPNFEYLAALHPDRVIVSPPAHANLEQDIRRIAELYKLRLFGPNLEVWPSLTRLTREMGKLSARKRQAGEYLESVEQRLARMAAALPEATPPLIIAEILDDKHMRVFGNGSVENAVLQKLGLENAWQGPTGQWGITTLTVREAFALEGRPVILLPSFRPELPRSGLWRHWLDDTVVTIDRNYWPWGGFPSALRFADALTEALSRPSRQSADNHNRQGGAVSETKEPIGQAKRRLAELTGEGRA